jgi:hypothetical protein
MSGIVNIHGKEYKTVALRVHEFKVEKPEWSITTQIYDANDVTVVMQAIIKDESDRVIGTGFAEEVRGSTNINKTSALENCETSAIGRALAACGFAGTEYASANEVTTAIIQQEVIKATDKLQMAIGKYKQFGIFVRDNLDAINYIKERLSDDDVAGARGALEDFSEEDQTMVLMAPTKGGIFTTEEIKYIRTGEK